LRVSVQTTETLNASFLVGDHAKIGRVMSELTRLIGNHARTSRAKSEISRLRVVHTRAGGAGSKLTRLRVECGDGATVRGSRGGSLVGRWAEHPVQGADALGMINSNSLRVVGGKRLNKFGVVRVSIVSDHGLEGVNTDSLSTRVNRLSMVVDDRLSWMRADRLRKTRHDWLGVIRGNGLNKVRAGGIHRMMRCHTKSSQGVDRLKMLMADRLRERGVDTLVQSVVALEG
jgi:hypothetical protein